MPGGKFCVQEPGIMFVVKQFANSAHKSGTTPGQVTVRLVRQLQFNGAFVLAS